MKKLINEYTNGYNLITQAINDVSDEELVYRPNEKSWNIKEVVIHLADSETVVVYRIKKIISEEEPLLNLMHQELWTKKLNYIDLDYRPYLELFRALRETTAMQLRTLEESDFYRIGIHETLGKISLKELIERYIEHVVGHVNQINRIKEEYKKQKNL